MRPCTNTYTHKHKKNYFHFKLHTDIIRRSIGDDEREIEREGVRRRGMQRKKNWRFIYLFSGIMCCGRVVKIHFWHLSAIPPNFYKETHRHTEGIIKYRAVFSSSSVLWASACCRIKPKMFRMVKSQCVANERTKKNQWMICWTSVNKSTNGIPNM